MSVNTITTTRNSRIRMNGFVNVRRNWSTAGAGLPWSTALSPNRARRLFTASAVRPSRSVENDFRVASAGSRAASTRRRCCPSGRAPRRLASVPVRVLRDAGRVSAMAGFKVSRSVRKKGRMGGVSSDSGATDHRSP